MSFVRRSMIVAVVVGSLSGGALLAACSSDSGSGADVKLSVAGQRGKVVAKEQGCISCHTPDGSSGTGPSWKGLAGSNVKLEDGTTVVADDGYLRTAILASRGQVVKGYANVMPVYDGEMTDAEVADVIAYLRDLAPAPTTTSAPAS